MLSEYSTETLDKILCLLFINICEDLICNSLAWKTATSKVSSVYTELQLQLQLLPVIALRSIFCTGCTYKLKCAFWHVRERKSELMLSFIMLSFINWAWPRLLKCTLRVYPMVPYGLDQVVHTCYTERSHSML